MYKSVLLTNNEIHLLSEIITKYLADNLNKESINLTIILNRLREKSPRNP